MSTLKAVCALFLICIMSVPAQADRGRGSDRDRDELRSSFESSDSSFDDSDDDSDDDSRSRSRENRGERSSEDRGERSRETGFEESDSISLAEERSNTEVDIGNLNRARNVAICLAGENTRVVRNPKKADCNSLVWFNVRDSVVNGAKILQNALNDTLASGGEVQAVCKSCTATCQTVAWISGQSSYNDIDVGGGQTPSECIDQAADACGAGYSRFLFSATCKQ